MANKNQTKVYKYSLEGELLAIYDSISIAAQDGKIPKSSIANALYGGTKFNISHKKIWLRESIAGDICKIVADRKKAMTLDGKMRKSEPIDNKVERRGNYIFIEKNLPAVERCIRCAMYNSPMECPPCDKRDRADGKEGYWRYCKPMKR